MDLNGSDFWYVGIALVLAALALSFVGIRGKDSFPPSGMVLWGVMALFAALVVGAGAFAVANASEEQDKRNEELAGESAQAEAAVTEEAPAGAPAGAAETLDVTSPADGGLVFEPADLAAEAGTITLAYANPSPVPHSIAVEDDGQENVLAESEVITESEVEITAEFVPGEFIYFCTVPGHREAGMEGVLTVQ
jgi:plastocyanin